MKTCCMCKQDLDVFCFKSNKKRKDGLQCQCIECHKKYRREHYLINKEKYIAKAAVKKRELQRWWREYKKTLSCLECGENHPACLDFHHPDSNKNGDVSRLALDGSRQRLLAEIKKCEVLCSNCHRKRHWIV